METVRVLVSQEPRPTRQHNNDEWIALSAGENYQLQVASPFSTAVKAVVCVDGLNVMTGKTTQDVTAAPGVVLVPGEAVTIPGWRVGKEEWASFEVNGRDRSYADSQHQPASECGRIDIHYIAGFTATPTPMVRGEVAADVGTAFGAFRNASLVDREFFPAKPLLTKTIFYASPEALQAASLPPVPGPQYCEPPANWQTEAPAKTRGRKKKPSDAAE